MVDLGRRLEKLERARPAARVPKLVRLWIADEDEAAALRDAEAQELDARPEGADVLLIRLVSLLDGSCTRDVGCTIAHR